MTKLGIFAATILAAAGTCCGVSAANAAPKTCTGLWDFIETDCQLTWYGITLYGVVDAGFGYQSHGAPFDSRSPPGSAYIVQRYSRSARWDVAPNGLQNSFIGIKGTEPIGGDTSVIFALDAGFDPYSFKIVQRTGIGCSQRRRSPGPANLVGRFEPSRAVVQRKRLCRPQLSELWHADGLPAERADV